MTKKALHTIPLTLSLLVTTPLFAQYYGERVLEKSFEKTEFFFTPTQNQFLRKNRSLTSHGLTIVQSPYSSSMWRFLAVLRKTFVSCTSLEF